MPSIPAERNPHPARLCRIARTPNFNGYGFNLHTIKDKTGQYIGVVDEGSPAEKAMLRKGDRIVEVNSVNVDNENHKQVVARIKLVPDTTTLLVVDEAGEQWYSQRKIVITSDLPDIVHGSSVDSRRGSLSSAETPPDDDKRSERAPSEVSTSSSNRQKTESESKVVPNSNDNEEYTVEFSDEESIHETPEPVVTADKTDEVHDTNGNRKESTSSGESIAAELIKNDKQDECPAEKEVSEVKPVVTHETNLSDEKKLESNSEVEKENLKNMNNEPLEKTVETANSSRRSSTSSAKSSIGSGEDSIATSQGTDPIGDKSPMSTSPSPPSSVGAPSPSPPPASTAPSYSSKNTGGLNMNMSAAEMRAYIASKKKKDIRTKEMDARQKYDIVQKL